MSPKRSLLAAGPHCHSISTIFSTQQPVLSLDRADEIPGHHRRLSDFAAALLPIESNHQHADGCFRDGSAECQFTTGSAGSSFSYPTTPQCFSNVPSTDPYFKFVQGLARLNVIPYEKALPACPTGTAFNEGNSITRIQAVPYAVRGILGNQSY